MKCFTVTCLELKVEQNKGETRVLPASSALGDKSNDKKVQRKGYKYASESQAEDQGQFYDKIFLEQKKRGGEVYA